MKTTAILYAILGLCSALVIRQNANNVDYSNLTVAVVRAPPANLPYPPPSTDWNGRTYDLNRTVDLCVGYIKEAALKGANFVAFPELWFPGYYFGPQDGPSEFFNHYLGQGLVVNSSNWHRLLQAARDNAVWLEFGFARLDGDLTYMGQAIVDPDGQVVQIRDKLRPSGAERTIFSDGTMDMIKVHQTPWGRMGALECWEHMWPSMTFSMHAQIENFHIATFPWGPDLGVDIGLESADVSLASARIHAVTGSTWVFMPSVGTAAIIAPNGTVVRQIEASSGPLAEPTIYHSLNTTEFAGTPDYDLDGGFSWAALRQIDEGYPKYIPKAEGNFIPFRENSITRMKKEGPLPLNY
ncbi:hypothetical protein CBER1_02169 [Cercospora berteroae]|uniref:nitrilase n=1 Tax=Cercospora berteroae TaxID=357750 RepID=A0A2S6BQC5_9PEZI|nr:hypothetical protein CBER1_02169 [Cercospora berteroae]